MARLLFDRFVLLLLENRSFDHLFDYLGIGDGISQGGATNYPKPDGTTSEKCVSRKGGDYTAIGEGLSHSLKQTNEQLFGKTEPPANVAATEPVMDGFVSSFAVSLRYDLRREPTSSEPQQVMNCFDPIQLPVLSTLAKNLVLCDRWFADVPGPRMPNRAFVHAARSQGYTDNAGWKPKFSCKMLYDRINADRSSSWRVYSHDQDDGLPLYPTQKSGTTNHSPFANYAGDVAGDKLATYSFITPVYIGAPEQPINSMACLCRRQAPQETDRRRLQRATRASRGLEEDVTRNSLTATYGDS
jgi:phospholipase C